MEDLEAFKESRVKMDPSSRKLTDHQWQQAFEAHQRARGRLSGGGEGSSRKRRRSSSKSHSARGQHQPSSQSALGALRHTVRQQSAYRDLRLVVDILFWTGIALVVLAAVLSLTYYTSTVAIVALLEGLVTVIAIVFVRLLFHVIIDIPDIALYRELIESSDDTPPSLDQDS